MHLAKLLVRIRGAIAVSDPEVATALKLSDTQQLRIQDVNRRNVASLRSRLRELLLKRQPLRDSLRELQTESERHVLSVLTPEQQRKLELLRKDSAA